MSKYIVAGLTILLVSVWLYALALSVQKPEPITLESAFTAITAEIGNAGYVQSSFYVFEDGSASTVYLVFDENDNLVYQWPEWSKGKDLG